MKTTNKIILIFLLLLGFLSYELRESEQNKRLDKIEKQIEVKP